MTISNELLRSLESSLRKRYSDKYKNFGVNPRSLGWDTLENQRIRFGLATASIDFKRRSVLDIGCGLSDFNSYLQELLSHDQGTYTGYDINQDFISLNKQRYPQSTFEVKNILTDPPKVPLWDIVTLFGILNTNFENVSNIDFAKQIISIAYASSREAVTVDMMSVVRDHTYPKEDFIFYYDPMEMFEFALTLTPYVQLRHDQASIPQREFLLILRRSPWNQDP